MASPPAIAAMEELSGSGEPDILAGLHIRIVDSRRDAALGDVLAARAVDDGPLGGDDVDRESEGAGEPLLVAGRVVGTGCRSFMAIGR